MKTFLKIIIPTFIYKKLWASLLLRKYLTKMNFILHQSHIGIYDNAKDLKEDLLKRKVPQTIGNNDTNQEHVNIQIERNRNNANDFKNNARITWNERESFLCHALTFFPSKEINVLDVGGGLKPCYFTLNYSLTQKIKCHVIEWENIVKGAKEIYGNIQDLTYSSNYPENKTFDVVYFGSSIQYFDDLSGLFEKIKNYQPRLIVFSYSSFAEEHETFTTGAYTFHRKFITPTTVYNINEFIDFFSRNNYQLKHKSLMQNHGWHIQHALEVKTRIYNLVFENEV
jgi:putative methyltransferase (TIGR04325 family)